MQKRIIKLNDLTKNRFILNVNDFDENGTRTDVEIHFTRVELEELAKCILDIGLEVRVKHGDE